MIEREHVTLEGVKEPVFIQIPSESGRGQWCLRCPERQIAICSLYGDSNKPIWILRAGTLDNPNVLKPTAQIYTSSKQAWVELSEEVPAFEKFYDRATIWSRENLQRFQKCIGA